MQFKMSETAGISVIEVEGNILGGADASQLNDIVHKLIKEGKKNFVISLRSVDLINSSGLGILISNLTNVKNNGGDMRLAELTDKVKQVLTITKLSSVFKVFASIDEAVKSFA